MCDEKKTALESMADTIKILAGELWTAERTLASIRSSNHTVGDQHEALAQQVHTLAKENAELQQTLGQLHRSAEGVAERHRSEIGRMGGIITMLFTKARKVKDCVTIDGGAFVVPLETFEKAQRDWDAIIAERGRGEEPK